MPQYIPPHMIPPKNRLDQFHEVQIPLYDQVPPPGWKPNGNREEAPKNERPAYNPEVPRWDF